MSGAGSVASLLPGPLKIIGKLLSATTQAAGKLAEFAKKPLEIVQQAAGRDSGMSQGGGSNKAINAKDNSGLQHAISGMSQVDKEAAIDSGSSFEKSASMHH